MKQAQIRCRDWLQKSCLDKFDTLACEAATTFCTTELGDPIFASGEQHVLSTELNVLKTLVVGWNPYDLGRKCEGPIEKTLCYPVTQ